MKKCLIVRKEKISKTLANKPISGRRLLEPLKSLVISQNLPFKIFEVVNVPKIEFYEIHKHEADLFCCLEGKLVFAYGGKLVNPKFSESNGIIDKNTLLAKKIKDSKKTVLKSGDLIFVPPGQPHAQKCAGIARFMIIKIPMK